MLMVRRDERQGACVGFKRGPVPIKKRLLKLGGLTSEEGHRADIFGRLTSVLFVLRI